MTKQIGAQEDAVRSMIRRSSELFPEKTEYRKIDELRIGWA